MYFVYLIECKDGSLYTGITTNIERRFAEHKTGIGGHYTKSKEVVRVVYTEQYPDRSSALKREAQIKGWRREKKLNLITGKMVAVPITSKGIGRPIPFVFSSVAFRACYRWTVLEASYCNRVKNSILGSVCVC